MIAATVRWELVLLRRSAAAMLPALCLGALVLLSFLSIAIANGRDNYQRATVAAAERERWLNQGAKDAHYAAHFSIFAFKPAPALAALDPGIADFVGQSVWLEAHHQDDMLYRPAQDASPLQRMGRADPTGLLIVFAPLLAFVLAFGAMARERDTGTLRLALGVATSPVRLVAAKALAIWAALAVTLLLPVAVLAPVAAVLGGGWSGDVAARLALWTMMVASYLGIVAMLGVAVAAALPRTRLALCLLFGGWLLLALVLPRLASERADDAHPLPSSQQVQQALLDRAPAYWTPESSAEHYRTLFARYGVGRREDMPVDARGAELDLAERRSHRVFDQVLGGFYDQVERQDGAFARASIVSPAMAVQAASATIAGGDFAQHRTFIDAAEGYRRALVNRMNAAVTAHVHNNGGPRAVDDRRLWAQVPPFAYAPPRVGGGMTRLVLPAFALALWTVAAWGLLIFSAGRMRA